MFSSRLATRDDIATITALAEIDMEARQALDPLLWRRHSEAASRISQSINGAAEKPDGPLGWLVMESEARVVGVARFAVIPAPPVYDLEGGLAGLILDDSYVAEDAPTGTFDALLSSVEDHLRGRGATVLIAACPELDNRKRQILADRGYTAVTQYLVKHHVAARDDSHAQSATLGDIPAIVALNHAAQIHRERLSPRFWKAHPEADSRFSAWMTQTLKAEDRNILVSGDAGQKIGFLVTQPIGPVHLPLASDPAYLGFIDDFHALSFDGPASGEGGKEAAQLLIAAENDVAGRGKQSLMIVSPAEWRSKSDFLKSKGYKPGNLWMLKCLEQ